MNILFVSRLYLPHLGGVEVHLREISSILLKEGHKVTIITSQHDKKLSLYAEYDSVKVIRIPFEVLEDKKQTWNSIKKYRSLFIEADIVHVHDIFWWLLPVYFDIRNKVYITFHGWETKLPIPNNAKIHRLLVSKLVRGSIHVGKFIQNFYWDKPNDVIYGGINQKRFTKSNLFEQTNDSAELRFVFVGRLDDDTDINMYINFLKILKNKKIKFSVTWVGDGSKSKECEKIGKVTGFIKNISQYIVKADYVFASSYLSILEAQCLGKIVVAFHSNPLKKDYLETFPGSSHMLISGTEENMVAKIEHVFMSEKLKNQMQKDAILFAKEYSWDKVVSVYKKLWIKSLN